MKKTIFNKWGINSKDSGWCHIVVTENNKVVNVYVNGKLFV